MQELCLKNCDQDVQKLENLSKGGMVCEQTVYRKGFRPCCMLAASAVKAPGLALPLASSNELTSDRGSSPLLSRRGSQGNCHSCHTGWSSRLPDWLYPSQAATNSTGLVSKSVQAVRTTLHGTSCPVAC